MRFSHTKHEGLLAALLEEARRAGSRSLLKTTLVKFLYLLDVYAARESGGKQYTDLRWRFLHYGPYASEIEDALKDLLSCNAIASEVRERDEDDSFYQCYSARRHISLADVGVPRSVVFHLALDVRKFSHDLPGLLDKVYFNTEPMANALPGSYLDFSKCERVNINDYKHVQMKPLPPKALLEVRTKLAKATEARRKMAPPSEGLYDEVFWGGMELLEESPLPAGLSGVARLKTTE